MKNNYIITAIIIIFLIGGVDISKAQWIRQYPYTSGLTFNDIEFINKNTGWICGYGKILKTTNMGVNWIEQNQPVTNKYLNSICPVDSNIVYCVGWFETILKTTNGGENWFALRNGPVGEGNSYESTFFINELTGWIGGYRLQAYKTIDGGKTFDSTYVNLDIKDIHFKDSNTGLMVGGGGVYKTTNQGENWVYTFLPTFNFAHFDKISVINNKNCFVVETGRKVYKSSNYGDTWDSISYINSPYNLATECRFSSLQTGWVGFGDINQSLFKSTDSGATWNIEYINIYPRGGIMSMYFYNDSIGWIIGGNGTIFFTSTGGITFANQTGIETPTKYALEQNYPNPFNSQTVIFYSIPKKSNIQLIMYDITGRKIKEIENVIKDPGNYSFVLDASGLSNGIYFIRLTSDNYFNQTIKIVLIK